MGTMQGIRNVPFRLRVRIERRRNDDEDAKVLGCFSSPAFYSMLFPAWV